MASRRRLIHRCLLTLQLGLRPLQLADAVHRREALLRDLPQAVEEGDGGLHHRTVRMTGVDRPMENRMAEHQHVSTQFDADRLPAICGSETFTTVVSSTSMNVPNITTIATSQGFTWG